MAAFGTEKTPTTSLNLGMPAAFSYNYANRHFPERYAPASYVGTDPLPEGTDFQATWHDQKRKDAHHMAIQKVKSTVMSGVRAFSSAHGVYGMPKPVLGQRKFANPSYASQTDWSTRWDNPSAGAPWAMVENTARGGASCGGSDGVMVGGVMRTSSGQAYGKSLLTARIGQLNKMEAAARRFQLQVAGAPDDEIARQMVPFAGAEPSVRQQIGQTAAVELAGVLQSVVDSLIQGGGGEAEEGEYGVVANKLTFTESARAFALIVRIATTGTAADIENILEYIDGTSAEDGILSLIDALSEGRDAQQATRAKRILLNSLDIYWKKVRTYLRQMLPLVGRPAKDRLVGSKTYINSGGFTKLFQTNRMPVAGIQGDNLQQAMDNDAPGFPGGGPGGGGGDGGGDDLDGDGGGGGGGGGGLWRGDRPVTREDGQHGHRGPGAEFSSNEQNTLANDSGAPANAWGQTAGHANETPTYAGEEPAANIRSYEQGQLQGTMAADDSLRRIGDQLELRPSRYDREIEGYVPGGGDVPDTPPDEDFGLATPGSSAVYSKPKRRFRIRPSEIAAAAHGDESAAPAPAPPALSIRPAPRIIGGPRYELGLPASRAQPRIGENREQLAARLAHEEELRSFALPPTPAPAPAPAAAPIRTFNVPPAVARAREANAAARAAAPAAASPIPTRQRDLPTTAEGYRELARRVNAHYRNSLPDGKGPINVSSEIADNIRKNFIKRFDLRGKY